MRDRLRLLHVETEAAALRSRRASDASAALKQQLQQVQVDSAAKLKDAERVLADLLGSCDKQRRAAEKARSRANEMEAERDRFRSSLFECEQQMADLRRQLSEKTLELLDSKSQQHEFDHQVTAYQSSLSEHEVDCNDSSIDRDENNRNDDSVETDNGAGHELKLLKQQISEYECALKSAEEQCHEAESRLREKASELESMRICMNDSLATINSLRSQLDTLQSEAQSREMTQLACERRWESIAVDLARREMCMEDFNALHQLDDLVQEDPELPGADDHVDFDEARHCQEYDEDGALMRLEDLSGHELRLLDRCLWRGSRKVLNHVLAGRVGCDVSTSRIRDQVTRISSEHDVTTIGSSEGLNVEDTFPMATSLKADTSTAVALPRTAGVRLEETIVDAVNGPAPKMEQSPVSGSAVGVCVADTVQLQFDEIFSELARANESLYRRSSPLTLQEELQELLDAISEKVSEAMRVNVSSVVTLEATLEAARSFVSEYEVVSASLMDQIRYNDQSIANMREICDGKDETIRSLVSEAESLRQQQYDTGGQVAYLSSLLRAAEDEIVSLKGWVEASESQSVFLTSQLEALRRQVADVTDLKRVESDSAPVALHTHGRVQETKAVHDDVNELFRKIAEFEGDDDPSQHVFLSVDDVGLDWSGPWSDTPCCNAVEAEEGVLVVEDGSWGRDTHADAPDCKLSVTAIDANALTLVRLQETETLVEDLRASNASLEARNGELQDTLTKMQIHWPPNTLNTNASTYSKELSEAQVLHEKLKAANDEIASLYTEKGEIFNLETELQAARDTLQLTVQSLHEVTEEKMRLEAQMATVSEAFRLQETGFAQRLSDLNGVLRAQKERFDAVATALKESDEKNISMKAKMTKLVRREVELEHVLIQAGLSQTSDSPAAPKAAISMLMEQASDLQKRLEKSKDENARAVQEWREREVELQAEIEAGRTLLALEKAASESEKESRAQLETELVNLTLEYDDLKHKLQWEVYHERRLRGVLETHFNINAVHLEESLSRQGSIATSTEASLREPMRDDLTSSRNRGLRETGKSGTSLYGGEHEGSMVSSLRGSDLDWGDGVGRGVDKTCSSRLSAEGEGAQSVL